MRTLDETVQRTVINCNGMQLYKIIDFDVFVGDASVGKSAISQVFHSDNSQFPRNYTMVRLSEAGY